MGFKVGDKVIIIGSIYQTYHKVGDIGLITGESETFINRLLKVVKIKNDTPVGEALWYGETELMLYNEYRLKVELGLMESINENDT